MPDNRNFMTIKVTESAKLLKDDFTRAYDKGFRDLSLDFSDVSVVGSGLIDTVIQIHKKISCDRGHVFIIPGDNLTVFRINNIDKIDGIMFEYLPLLSF